VNISQIHHTFIVSRKESSIPATVKKGTIIKKN